MTKNYEEILASLKDGLKQINKVLRDTSLRRLYNRAFKNKEIQEERIEFFKMGYNLCRREINSQDKLP